MRRQVLFVGLICVAFLVNAQEEKTIDLDEVTIQASSIIRKKDRQLIFPSKDQVRRSMDGLDLTRRMSLPRLWVDPNTKSISMANGNVQLRINGVLASSLEVAALSPEDIKRWNITITRLAIWGRNRYRLGLYNDQADFRRKSRRGFKPSIKHVLDGRLYIWYKPRDVRVSLSSFCDHRYKKRHGKTEGNLSYTGGRYLPAEHIEANPEGRG